MEKELEILILVDDPADADRLMHELSRQGVAFCAHRVETQEAFLRQLEAQPPDLILSDHGVHALNGFAALEIVQEKFPQVPFVFVTGYYDQGLVVEMFDSGAAGYVHKNRLADLVPVLRQAQEEIRQRNEARAGQDAGEGKVAAGRPLDLRAGAEKGECLICSQCKKVCDEHGNWEELDSYLRRNQRATVTLALCPACTVSDALSRNIKSVKTGSRFVVPRSSTPPGSG